MKACTRCGAAHELAYGPCGRCRRFPHRLLGKPCVVCGVVGTTEAPLRIGARHEWCGGIRHDRPESIRLNLPWELDEGARVFVLLHPSGATQAEVAEEFGVSRQRIEQIEKAAIAKLLAACAPHMGETRPTVDGGPRANGHGNPDTDTEPSTARAEERAA